MFENNIGYLLHSFTVTQMLRPFRIRAGEKTPSSAPYPKGFWSSLPGSCAGRFLMGAGNTLCWAKDAELRQRMDEVVSGIEACKMPNGYIMAYPEDQFTFSEYGNYVRSWVTQGLLAAGKSGNETAYRLIRGYQDWFDHCKYLPVASNLRLGYQGMLPNTLIYFSPVGKADDIRVVQKYYEEDWWLNQFIARDPKAVWERPKHSPHTHCYEINALVAYLDLYRATGQRRYLDAVLGGWQLFHDDWTHLGGSIAISEGPQYPPQSYYLHSDTGETCCSVFWIMLNHRLHLLFPSQEKYTNEIEQSIYNVLLANQDGTRGIRYHAELDGHKEEGQCNNTCCEGQGTKLYGSLPGLVFSTTHHGLYVDLYAASTINWNLQGSPVSVKMVTQFPRQSDVFLSVSTPHSVPFALHVRIPSWAAHRMPIAVNGKIIGVGRPGSYFVINRTWNDRDRVAFSLPMSFRVVPYSGFAQIFDTCRYGVEYGPILMAFTGPLDYAGCIGFHYRPEDIKSWLVVRPDDPLHFSVKGYPMYACIPYWQITSQTFTCFPVIQPDLHIN